jgi:hypothetical protein
MYRFTIVVCIVALIFLTNLCLADIPKLINYQGMLTDDAGNPLTDTVRITFKIYNDSLSASPINKKWEETHSDVSVIDGLFNVMLGGVSSLNLDFSEDYWLDITVEGEHQPERLRFVSVGYAYRAKVADSATVATSTQTGGGWVDDGTIVRLQDSTDAVGIGTAIPRENLHLKGSGRVAMQFDNGGDTSWVIESRSFDKGLAIWLKTLQGGYQVAYFSPQGDTWLVPISGNLGVGTTSPGVKLHIDGGGDVKVNTPNTGYLIMGSSTGSHIAIDNNEIMAKASGDSIGDLYIQWTDEARTLIKGKVGIGTAEPGCKLHVAAEGSGSAVCGEHKSSGNDGVLGGDHEGVSGSSYDDVGVYGISGSGWGVWGNSVSGTGVYYTGGLAGSGSKSCIVKTSQGPTLLYCQESPENWFEDFGEGQLSAGRCHIELDPLFLETVTINETNLMKVFIQLNDDCNGTYVERDRTGFDVIELQGGQSSARFTYRVVAKRSGFEGKRLDVCEAAKKDPYLYPEMKETMDME